MSDRPTYDQVRRFLRVDGGWTKSGGQNPHERYTKTLPDSRQLYTTVPKGNGRVRNGGFFTHMLSQQLEVTAQQFWDAVNKDIPPPRDAAPPGHRLRYELVRDLVYKVKLSQEEIRSLSPEQAEDIWERWQAEQAEEPPSSASGTGKS